MELGKYLCLEGHVDDVPLGGDHHLHHDDEEQAQQLIDLEKKSSENNIVDTTTFGIVAVICLKPLQR